MFVADPFQTFHIQDMKSVVEFGIGCWHTPITPESVGEIIILKDGPDGAELQSFGIAA